MKLLWRLTKQAKQYKWQYVVAITATFLCAAVNLIAPKFVSQMTTIVSEGVTEEKLTQILYIALALAGMYIIRVGLKFLSDYLAHVAAWNLVSNTRIELYDHMQRLSLTFYHDKQTGDLMSRVVNDTATFEMLYAHIIPELFTNVLTAGGVFAILMTVNWKLGLLTCLPIPFLLFICIFFSKKVRPNFRKAQRATGEISGKLQDSFSGILEVQSFGREEYEYQSVTNVVHSHRTQILAALKKGAIFRPWIEFFSSIGSVIVVGVGGVLAFRNELTVGDIVAFLLYLNLFYQPIASLARLLEDGQNAYAGAERVMSIMDTESEIKDTQNAKDIENVKGAIEFKNVSFSYANGTKVLDDVSFSCEAGKMCALVGATGVGKTTLTKLIPRFYDPDSGEILLDGINIKDVTLASLRKSISPVMQDTFLFNATIAENISYAKPDATQEEIIAAAKAADIHEEIMATENGYETRVGERGVRLSGGQKQRIAIARAVLRNAPIIILDEATASVDNETENKIQEALAKLNGKHTIIAIAHRLSTIRNADEILVLKDGRVAERGNNDELMALNGIYAELNTASKKAL